MLLRKFSWRMKEKQNKMLYSSGVLCSLRKRAHGCQSGPSCSKLTTSLVNDSLKFISRDTKYAEIFCWKNVSSICNAKATHIFSTKNIRILYIESAKTVNEMTPNELVKLTTLWTTGPRSKMRPAEILIRLIFAGRTSDDTFPDVSGHFRTLRLNLSAKLI